MQATNEPQDSAKDGAAPFIPPERFAFTTLQMLMERPARYVNYGVYWFFVKALLKKYYTKDNLYLLGDYTDEGISARMPEHEGLQDAMRQAIATFNYNATYNMGRSVVMAPDGDRVTIYDEDVGL